MPRNRVDMGLGRLALAALVAQRLVGVVALVLLLIAASTAVYFRYEYNALSIEAEINKLFGEEPKKAQEQPTEKIEKKEAPAEKKAEPSSFDEM